MKSLRRGFTLIELLIVVAIIAILAAIAVPNFLEAQMRAKIASARANERSIVTASEAYRVDNNSALPASGETDTIGASVYSAQAFNWIWRWGYWTALTTPVAYMSTIPQDIFLKMWALQLPADFQKIPYYLRCPIDMWDVNIGRAILKGASAPGIWGPINPTIRNTSNKFWCDTYLFAACKNANHVNANYFMRGWGPSYLGALGGNGIWQGGISYIIPYDPTNGTVSFGDIFYFN